MLSWWSFPYYLVRTKKVQIFQPQIASELWPILVKAAHKVTLWRWWVLDLRILLLLKGFVSVRLFFFYIIRKWSLVITASGNSIMKFKEVCLFENKWLFVNVWRYTRMFRNTSPLQVFRIPPQMNFYSSAEHVKGQKEISKRVLVVHSALQIGCDPVLFR